MSGYGADLAYIHDAGFGDFARKSAPGLLAILRQAGIRGGLVVDLGCGSGIWAAELTRRGYDVLGIDISRAMIRLARARTCSQVHPGILLKRKASTVRCRDRPGRNLQLHLRRP